MTKHGPPYTPDEWIPEIPFDVAEWGDKEGRYADGLPLFESEEIFQQALRDSEKLLKHPPLPGVPDERAEIFEARQGLEFQTKRAGDASTSPPMTPKE